MTYHLTDKECDNYTKDGYLFPVDIFDQKGVDTILKELEIACEQARQNGLADQLQSLLRTNVHLSIPMVCRIARTAQIVDRVTSILGQDVLLWSSEFFIKPAQTEKIVSWHQDLTYWGLGETDDEVSVWLALSNVNTKSGCMQFIPGSHKQSIVAHHDTFNENNLLSRGQEVSVEVDEADAVNVELKPGQVSFHHGRIFHASGPNSSAEDRVGLVFRFITPKVRQLVAKRDYAMQIHGIDESKNWIHVAEPLRDFDNDGLKLREQIRNDQLQALASGAKKALYQSA